MQTTAEDWIKVIRDGIFKNRIRELEPVKKKNIERIRLEFSLLSGNARHKAFEALMYFLTVEVLAKIHVQDLVALYADFPLTDLERHRLYQMIRNNKPNNEGARAALLHFVAEKGQTINWKEMMRSPGFHSMRFEALEVSDACWLSGNQLQAELMLADALQRGNITRADFHAQHERWRAREGRLQTA